MPRRRRHHPVSGIPSWIRLSAAMRRWRQSRPAPCGLSARQAASTPAAAWQEDPGHLETATHQLQEYFQGQRQSFTLPLAPPGTPFQQRVWQELQRIPFGTTLTYRELAQRLGMPQAARGACQWPESARYRDSLSPPHWKRWPVARLCEWYRPEAASLTARRRTTL